MAQSVLQAAGTNTLIPLPPHLRPLQSRLDWYQSPEQQRIEAAEHAAFKALTGEVATPATLEAARQTNSVADSLENYKSTFKATLDMASANSFWLQQAGMAARAGRWEDFDKAQQEISKVQQLAIKADPNGTLTQWLGSTRQQWAGSSAVGKTAALASGAALGLVTGGPLGAAIGMASSILTGPPDATYNEMFGKATMDYARRFKISADEAASIASQLTPVLLGLEYAGSLALGHGIGKAFNRIAAKVTGGLAQTLASMGLVAAESGTEEAVTQVAQNVAEELTLRAKAENYGELPPAWSESISAFTQGVKESFEIGAVIGGGTGAFTGTLQALTAEQVPGALNVKQTAEEFNEAPQTSRRQKTIQAVKILRDMRRTSMTPEDAIREAWGGKWGSLQSLVGTALPKQLQNLVDNFGLDALVQAQTMGEQLQQELVSFASTGTLSEAGRMALKESVELSKLIGKYGSAYEQFEAYFDMTDSQLREELANVEGDPIATGIINALLNKDAGQMFAAISYLPADYWTSATVRSAIKQLSNEETIDPVKGSRSLMQSLKAAFHSSTATMRSLLETMDSEFFNTGLLLRLHDADVRANDWRRVYKQRLRNLYMTAYGLTSKSRANHRMWRDNRGTHVIIDLMDQGSGKPTRSVKLNRSQARELLAYYYNGSEFTLEDANIYIKGFRYDTLATLLDSMTDADIAFIKGTIKLYSQMYGKANGTHMVLTGERLSRVKNYTPIYRRNDDLSMETGRWLTPSFIEKRKGSGSMPLLFGDTTKLSRYADNVAHYTNVTPVTQQIEAVFKDSSLQKAIIDKRGPDYYQLMEQQLKLVMNNGWLANDTRSAIDGLVTRTVRRVGVALVGMNPNSVIRQVIGQVYWAAHMPVGAYVSGTIDFWKHPSKNMRELRQRSAWYRDRSENIDIDFSRVGDPHPTVDEVFTWSIKFSDKLGVAPGMWAYSKYLESTGMNPTAAIRQAELLGNKSQQTGSILDQSIARKNPWIRAVTMFTSWQHQLLLLLTHKGQLYRQGKISGGELTKVFTVYLGIAPAVSAFATAMLGSYIKTGEAPEKKELRDEMVYDVAHGFVVDPFTSLPAVNFVVDAATSIAFQALFSSLEWNAPQYRDIAGTPVLDVFNSLNHGISRFINDLQKDKDITFEDYMRLMGDAATFTGIPRKPFQITKDVAGWDAMKK